jgi:hypothetical protein
MSRNNGSLTPEERLRCAFGHIVLGIDKQDLAALFGVSSGRITEVVRAVEIAINDPLALYKPTVISRETTNGQEDHVHGGAGLGSERGDEGRPPAAGDGLDGAEHEA